MLKNIKIKSITGEENFSNPGATPPTAGFTRLYFARLAKMRD